MIQSFRDKDAEQIFNRQPSRRLGAIAEVAYRKLMALDLAEKLEHLMLPPGNRLEALKGDRKGWHSIRVNNRWRVCFRWAEPHAYDVEIVDYH